VIPPISRRQALILGGLGAAGVAVGAVGLGLGPTSVPAPVGGGRLVEPPVLPSAGGILSLRLEAARTRVQIGGRTATALTYNGRLPGPTLYLTPGDRLRVRLVNSLADPTNLHVHGLSVSPAGNGDNVFVAVGPGESFDYDHRLPDDHPPGVFWYHPHRHHLVADQLFGGLCGAIVVQDRQPIPVARERVLVVTDIGLDASGAVRPVSPMERMAGREGELVLVNGQAAPRMVARPGERERWRVVNACTSRFLRLRLDGQRLELLGRDSGRLAEPRQVDEVLLAPGNRADLLVTAVTGTGDLRTLPVDRGRPAGPAGGGARNGREVRLATFVVGGAAAAPAPPLPAQPAPRDLRGVDVARRRQLTFAMGMGGGMAGGGMGGMGFTIDGRAFDPARVDQVVAVGTVEEWTISNTSPMDHPFHLHVWPMQIIERGGRAEDAAIWQDVVNVPARSSVTVRVAFDRFGGRTVYHCHILDHEDLGMMATIDVQ
jgi:FtsP/CotA-like multicopper oxidase with cupredoxin domain